MARIDTLNNFLTDVAGAIKEKKGDNSLIKACNFDTEIRNLPSDDVLDYIDTNLVDENSASGYLIVRLIKKLPPMDTSEVTNMSYAYSRCSALEELEEQDWSKVSNINSAFAACTSLRIIHGLKNLGLGFPTNSAANTANCTANFTNCPLTRQSAINILNDVADIKSLGIAAQTIRFHADTFALLTNEDIAIVTPKGWSVTK